jgi:hypothetical protein
LNGIFSADLLSLVYIISQSPNQRPKNQNLNPNEIIAVHISVKLP